MSDTVEVNIAGIEAVVARIGAFSAGLRHELGSELYAFGRLVMDDAIANYVPEDMGALKNSGTVGDPVVEGATVSVRLSFGTPGAEEYAIAVHEHPSEFSPPSWQGKAVNFTVGGPKYLERPVMEHARDLPGVVEEALVTFAGRIVVATGGSGA